MPDIALANNQLTVEAERMLSATSETYIDGEDVARAIGRNPADAAVRDAFREVERQGRLKIEGWRGGMGLPAFVGLS
jgi:hypothetical protein